MIKIKSQKLFLGDKQNEYGFSLVSLVIHLESYYAELILCKHAWLGPKIQYTMINLTPWKLKQWSKTASNIKLYEK